MKIEQQIFDYKQFATFRERSMGRLLWRIKRWMDNFIEPKLHAAGFTDFKMSYLMFLANIEETGITNNELAKRACVSKQMMSKVVSLLEVEGYITTRKSETDSRSSMIFLSERGEELFITLKNHMGEAHAQFSTIIGSERVEQVIDILVDLTNGLEKQ